MISIEHLNGEIAALEDEKPTFAIMARLADLYCVRDHIAVGEKLRSSVLTPPNALPDIDSNTEFAQAIAGKDAKTVLTVMDELMSVVKVVNANLYAGVMRKL